MKIISYLRVSESPYGESALSLDIQREYIARAAEQNGWDIVDEFVDKSASKIAIEKRAEGARALAMCKELDAPLVVAQLDRLSRSPQHISHLIEEIKLDFKVATMANATPVELHIHAALLKQEQKFVNKFTSSTRALPLKTPSLELDTEFLEKFPHYAALQLGRTPENRKLAAEAVSDRVKAFHAEVQPHIQSSIDSGSATLTDIADSLNSKSVRTSRGGTWSATQVKRVMEAMNIKLAHSKPRT